jgi:SAM domain (Sterile alpha motif)
MDVGDWLRKLGLDQYEPAFRGNEIDARVLPSLPRVRRAVQGNSSIAETQLIFGVLAWWAARVDGRGFVDGGEVAALEEAQSDQIGEAQDRDLDAVAAGGDAQQRIGDHRGKDLEADRVVVVAEEAADVEMLFDPAKQQLDLPSSLVEGGDVDGGSFEVIGQQGDGFAVGALDPEPAQSDRQLRIALAGQAHLIVLEHGETVALGERDRALANEVEAHVGLGSGDEDRALASDRGPPAVVAIALIKDVGRPGLDRDRATDLGVVNVGVGDVEDARIVGLRVKDDMHLQAPNTPVRFGTIAQLAERNGRRIDQLHHRRAVASRLPIQLACHQAEGLSEERNRSPFVRIAQGRAHQRATAQMVMMLTVGVPTRFQAAQADGRGELGVDQRQQMVPARKRFDVGIAGVTLNERRELAPLDRFQQLTEDGRCEAHAPFSF